MRLLLTGFEPFGGESINPSGEVVRAIEADTPPGVELHATILPVYGRISFERLLPLIDEEEPDAWIGLGEAGGRSHVSVERVGINVLIDRQDRLRGHEEQTLVPDGPAAYFARLPVAAVARHIAANGVPAAVSNTAGTYICNEVTYSVLHHLATDVRWQGREMTAGFLHLPYLPEQTALKPAGTPSMALETQLRGVRAAIEFVAQHAAPVAGTATAR